MRYDDYMGLDFETYSGVDLNKHGLDRYASSDTFTPLIGSYSLAEGSAYGAVPVFRNFTLPLFQRLSVHLETLKAAIGDRFIVAHNAPFEQRVLAEQGLDYPSEQFIDSAAVARALGAGGKLEAAAPQLLDTDKLEDGRRLIKLFSIPGKYQEESGSLHFDSRIIGDHPDDWLLFSQYCELDAELGLRIALLGDSWITVDELKNNAITMEMNRTGWPVDIAKVEEMQRRYLENLDTALEDFRTKHNATDLNLNSLKQLKEWCSVRGIKATSFDKAHVDKLVTRIEKKLADPGLTLNQTQNYGEVLDMLKTKQILGGSSLKKLAVVLDTVGKDARLRDQYLHIGAGQTWRTTGRSVQMQNLKRLDAEDLGDMEELDDLDILWDNDKLAENIRQTFTSSHPQGALIVGDFKSVESRGLAWLAGATWKLDAYRQGKDMYRVQAATMFGKTYDLIEKKGPERQAGKVGELSCGYQAGGPAVQSFAAGMGIEMTEAEATKLVSDWRATNPEAVDLWDRLDALLRDVVMGGASMAVAKVGHQRQYKVRVFKIDTPTSLLRMHSTAQSIGVQLEHPNGRTILTRFFHGCYVRGNGIGYYKPSERKTGDPWKNHFTDPKTKQVKFYTIYGGKLAGILTQSFCRELFFGCLREVYRWSKDHGNVDLIGQFHDEIVLDWRPAPASLSLDSTKHYLGTLMSDSGDISGFPLEADIKHDYRYTK